MDTHRLGQHFERIAARHLEERGWRIIERNVRWRRKEVDLVIRRDDVVAFVEVKGRRGAGYGHPLEAITWRKRREIETVARWWIQLHAEEGLLYRFDAVAVEHEPGTRPRVEHVEGAWRVEGT